MQGRIFAVVAALVLALALGRVFASAPSYRIVHTRSGFGSLFVLATDPHGNLYVADQKHFQILKLSSSGRLLLKEPMPKKCGISGLAASSSGDVYAAANCRSEIYHFSPSGHLLGRFGNQPPGTNGVAVDRRGRVYVTYGAPPAPHGPPPGVIAKKFPSRFVEYSPTGTALRTVKLSGTREPWGIAVDKRGNVYVTAIGRLVKVAPNGKIVAQWSQAAPSRGLPPQPAVDPQGNVYAVGRSQAILKIGASGRLDGTVVRHGRGQDAVRQPAGMAVDSHGHLFAADEGPNRIKEFSLSGKLLAVWTP
ncbi:MAG: NHL repeat-containing protein [Chloroflexota bacterium]